MEPNEKGATFHRFILPHSIFILLIFSIFIYIVLNNVIIIIIVALNFE